jgi:DNA-directed RNA polymerase III subunit RPC1
MPGKMSDFPNVGWKKPATFNTKEVVDDKEPPQKIESIDFSICAGEEIVKNAVMEVKRDDMYTSVPTAPGQASIREAAPNGPLDRRMGTTNKDSKCKTCEADLTECAGTRSQKYSSSDVIQ